jgi:hypothetical protein
MSVIAFRSEFIFLPDADKKPLGTDAALFLSQLVWLTENQSDKRGWVEWTTEDCEKQTGIKPDTQYRICKRLEQAGYLKTDRRGEKGKRFLRCDTAICGNRTGQIPQIAETGIPDNEMRYRNLRKQKAEKTVSVSANCGNRIPQIAETESDLFLIKETKNKDKNILSDSPEFVAFYQAYPRKVSRPKACEAWKKLNPDAELVTRIMEGLQRVLPEWEQREVEYIPHPATWLNQHRWEDEGVSAGFSKAIPKNGHAPPLSSAEKNDRINSQIDRVMERNGIV